jgi:hypothetical protein
MLIPSLLERLPVFLHQPQEFCQLVAAEPTITRQPRRVEPELRIALRLLNVNVRRLIAFAAEEEEPITALPQHLGHTPILTATSHRR